MTRQDSLPSPPAQAVVIVVDRFGAGYMGPYGNTWVETPAMNRLASGSLLWEHAISDCPTLDGFYRAVGWGRHAWTPLPESNGDRHPRESLVARLTAAGVHTLLISDEPQIAEHPLANDFRERVLVPPVQACRTADSIDETQFAQTFAAALDAIDRVPQPFLLWLHLRGMAGSWDAPREFRESVADEEDPEPPGFVDPPSRLLPKNADPDEILGIIQAYAGQVILLDTCLGTWLQSLESSKRNDNTLLLFTSPRGYPLGEHGAIGEAGDGLHEESLHVPLLVRRPDQRQAMQRFQSLAQPSDIHATLNQWFFPANVPAEISADRIDLLALADGQASARECVASTYRDQRSLRTPVWLLRQVGSEPSHLFVKPDDRWEVNEVSNRCADVVEDGLQFLTSYEQAAKSTPSDALPKLPDRLLHSD